MVYLIHFERKLHHAQHYLGFAGGDLMQCIELHRANQGAKLLAAVNNNGIYWKVVRVWQKGDRTLERKLTNYKSQDAFALFALGKA